MFRVPLAKANGLALLGYIVFPYVLWAKHYGTSQRRSRLYMLVIMGSQDSLAFGKAVMDSTLQALRLPMPDFSESLMPRSDPRVHTQIDTWARKEKENKAGWKNMHEKHFGKHKLAYPVDTSRYLVMPHALGLGHLVSRELEVLVFVFKQSDRTGRKLERVLDIGQSIDRFRCESSDGSTPTLLPGTKLVVTDEERFGVVTPQELWHNQGYSMLDMFPFGPLDLTWSAHMELLGNCYNSGSFLAALLTLLSNCRWGT